LPKGINLSDYRRDCVQFAEFQQRRHRRFLARKLAGIRQGRLEVAAEDFGQAAAGQLMLPLARVSAPQDAIDQAAKYDIRKYRENCCPSPKCYPAGTLLKSATFKIYN
jgi:hypothetical protein